VENNRGVATAAGSDGLRRRRGITTSCSLRERFECDLVAGTFELRDEAFGLAFGVAFAEVVAAEVAVQLAGGEHVPDRAEDRVFDRAERAAVADSWFESTILGLEVAVVGSDRCMAASLSASLSHLGSGAAFAGRLVVAGALAGPGGAVAGGGEHRHVGADLIRKPAVARGIGADGGTAAPEKHAEPP